MSICLLHFPPPKRISDEVWEETLKKTQEKMKRLPNIIKRIEKAVGIPYPRIEIIPLAIIHPATERIYFGIFGWTPDKARRELVPVVHLTAPALLNANDNTLTCHLLHEILHYVDSVTLKLTDKEKLLGLVEDLKQRRGTVKGPTDYVKPEIEKGIESLAKTWIRDKDLLAMFLRYDTQTNMKDELYDSIMRKWIGKELPVADIKWFDETFVDIIKESIKRGIVKRAYVDPAILRKLSKTS